MTSKYKPSKLLVRWNKDLSITIYSGGRKLLKTEMYSWHRDLEAVIAPFCEGWFGSSDPADWRYRVTYN